MENMFHSHPSCISDLGKATNVSRTTINHPPVITIFNGGINLPFPVSRVGSKNGIVLPTWAAKETLGLAQEVLQEVLQVPGEFQWVHLEVGESWWFNGDLMVV